MPYFCPEEKVQSLFFFVCFVCFVLSTFLICVANKVLVLVEGVINGLV